MLGQDGLLPAGRHQVTTDVFRQQFVDAFGGSSTRARLFTRWQRHREALSSVVPIQAQWIDGSYVTDRLDPGDVDVVSLIDGPTFDALAPALQLMVSQLVSGSGTRAVWGIDSYLLPVYPGGHPLRPETVKGLTYWDNQWQRVKGNNQLTKGYLEVGT